MALKNKKQSLIISLITTLILLISLSFNTTASPSPSSSPSLDIENDPSNPSLSHVTFDHIPFFNHPLHHANNPYVNNPKPRTFEIESENLSENRNKKFLKLLGMSRPRRKDEFPVRVREFFNKKVNDTAACKIKFFMTWMAPLGMFNDRAIHSIESIFRTNPHACLLIVSNSLDSPKGREILGPFGEKGFRVIAVTPDFDFLFKNTMAEVWFSKLIRGHVKSGDIPLGQNISNLLRLCLLYKYGGVYVDTDIIVLRSFSRLKNAIGALSMDPDTKNWSRLNNAVLVFDKMHPLLYKFIEEFALTFNGNKWGHNGPYLISRVVLRLQGRPGYNFTVLPPIAFYPVNWDKVRVLFRAARNDDETEWLHMKYEQMRNQSYTVHFWNKQSRGYRIEDGSIIQKMFSIQCVFCNRTSTHDDTVSDME
ncbi:Alpha 1,4-glycosyltransferase domain-containing protein [Artemisia annua]|uniref:Alpha 1,4-glycosyltransferase domain-containing protein n=1 Tax=Artemisia annua TaxID=35608 RepID=A0A2U1QJJ4_ARTAN|nr:Alpha 1,4-glycosyltransferase domain-containing protein [Artemisia annua]